MAMIDPYNRKINYLRVSVTDRCNLRCTYCMPKEGLSLFGHDDILRYEEILRVIREAVGMGISKVRITGGEPLVRRGIVDFIASLQTVSGLQDVSLTTNGILLEGHAEKLARAGVRRINISLDSLRAEKYSLITRGGDLGAVLRGIDKVHQLGFSPIKINIVLVKGVNDDEILDFAKLTLSKPYQIRFIELMPLGRARMDNHSRYLPNDIAIRKIRKGMTLERVRDGRNGTDGPARIYRLANGVGEIGFISPVSHHFCASCNRLRLTADGHLRACLLADEEVDLKEPLRRGCPDGELAQFIHMAIQKKPPAHGLDEGDGRIKKCLKDMSAIGG